MVASHDSCGQSGKRACLIGAAPNVRVHAAVGVVAPKLSQDPQAQSSVCLKPICTVDVRLRYRTGIRVSAFFSEAPLKPEFYR